MAFNKAVGIGEDQREAFEILSLPFMREGRVKHLKGGDIK